MDNIIYIDFKNKTNITSKVIDVEIVKRSQKQLQLGLIKPSKEVVVEELAYEHTSEPIKNMDDIINISKYLIANNRYRDNMLFIVGINFGLRVSDLRSLRFSHIINDNFTFREQFSILEKKTRNTRKVKKNRYITINNAVIESITLFLENTPNISLSDYLFKSESNRGKNINEPLSNKSIDRILKGVAKDLSLGNKMSTHSLRKTFAYHQMVMSGNDPRKLLLLQKIFGHATAAQTLDYIGITGEEIQQAYLDLNLGSSTTNYLVDGSIFETEKALI